MTARHELVCDDPPLPKGAKRERQWRCACGVKFFGYDAPVRRAYRSHLES